jgi:hypothetical protein
MEEAYVPLRERLRAQSGLREERIFPCPLIGDVTIRKLSAREQLQVAERIPDDCENLVAMAHYIIATLIDEGGEAVYQPEDLEEVIALDPRILATISREVRDLLGLSIGVRDHAKN